MNKTAIIISLLTGWIWLGSLVGSSESMAQTPTTTSAQGQVPWHRQSWVLVVSGIGGEPHYSERFQRWSQSFSEVLSRYQGMTDEHIIRLAESSSDQDQNKFTRVTPHENSETQLLTKIDDTSTRDNVLAGLDTIADKAKQGDTVIILFIGHGSTDGTRTLFNVPGPDITQTDLIEPLARLKNQTVVLVNTTSSSSPFLTTLASPGRIVITATSNPAENQHAYFGEFFVSAFASTAADRNKDQRVSILEAFWFANQNTGQHYEKKSAIATEHAQLDDNGDGIGSQNPTLGESDEDGTFSASVFLSEAPEIGDYATEQSLKLDIAARSLVDKVESLKRTKTTLTDEMYNNELEKILIALAKNRRELRRELGLDINHE